MILRQLALISSMVVLGACAAGNASPDFERQRDNQQARSGAMSAARANYLTALKEFIPEARPRYARGEVLKGIYAQKTNLMDSAWNISEISASQIPT